RLALSGCSLVIQPGEKVAIVGQNGSGKTTILRLLAKIYLPDHGRVLFDGLPSSRITQTSWFEQLLLCTQDVRLPEFTIAETVAGTYPSQADQRRLENAAALARADTVIKELPLGFQTQLGSDWPNGW